MTNEEAIEQLKIIKQSLIDCGGCEGSRIDLHCIDIAIKALETKFNGCLACEYHNDCYDAFSHKSLNCPRYEEQENEDNN